MNNIIASSKKNDPLLQPLKLKHLVLRNRIMSTSHACGLEEGGMPKTAYQLYHAEKAKGGLALSMFGGSSNIDRDSPNIFRQLNVGTDEIIPYFQEFSSRLHAHGAALMCQITHLGRRGDSFAGDRLPTIAPSIIRETLHRSIPKEMDEYDIARIVKAYAAAAVRCKEGGLDGIETLAGGHLIGQFFSPLTNRRSDRFGGSLENRCRFALMVHEAIRKAAGDDFIVGIRLSVDEGTPGGLTLEDCIEIGVRLQAEGAVDFFNAVYGGMDTIRGLVVENMPGMGAPLAPWVEAVGQFKQAVQLPVFHAARLADVASARYAVSQGKIDMAAMTRAQIADPYLVEKLIEGREDEIRPCIGASHCQSAQRPSCLHNPVSGRETSLAHKVSKSEGPAKRIVVVGGGPAGLEAARVCAQRGHEVSLHEAASQLGGQVLIGASGSWRRDLIGLVDWRVAELDRLGVRTHTDSYLESADIAALEADVVIVATGGLPNISLADGADLCHSTWDVVSGNLNPRSDQRVLVFDGTGRHPAPLAAERLAGQGAEVSYHSIDGQLAEEMTYAERYRWKRRFLELGITPEFETRLVSVARSDDRLIATLCNELTATEHQLEVDVVVVEQGTLPLDDVYHDLRASSANDGVIDLEAFVAGRAQPRSGDNALALYRIGDAISSRNINTAILDAYRLCSSL